MCFLVTNLSNYKKWDWEGDRIVYDTIIPACRVIPNTNIGYDIDIREFLSFKDNAVIKKVINKITEGLNEKEKFLFYSKEKNSFDFRVRKILEYLTNNIQYERPRKGDLKQGKKPQKDVWMFPDETLSKKKGDCEDLSFLLASLMLASGISSYVVRVVLGKLYNHKTKKSFDHVWVMYKNETGLWTLLESVIFTKKTNKRSKDSHYKSKSMIEDKFEYIPYYLLNDEHLWRVDQNTVDTKFDEYLNSRIFWVKYDPSFATSVHNTIFDEALMESDKYSWFEKQWIKIISLWTDSVKSYDPRDHFDNGYIKESWENIQNRLSAGSLTDTAVAMHSIADFYAHTSYAHFAKTVNGKLELFDGKMTDALFENIPDYGKNDFDLHDIKKFTVNTGIWNESADERIKILNKKKIISGRFAQPDDPHQNFYDPEKILVNIPYELKKDDFDWRGCLPHHDEIAVDTPLSDGKIPKGHILYDDENKYREQFELRKNAAIEHIKSIL